MIDVCSISLFDIFGESIRHIDLSNINKHENTNRR